MKEFERTFAEQYPVVRKFLLRLSGDEELSEELTQETFYQALKHWGEFRGQSSVSTWLCTIARNLWVDRCKKHPAHQSLEESFDLADPNSPDPALTAERSDTAMGLYARLHRLEEPYKEVFLLRALGELSFRQIGELFGKTENWACVTYHRARKKLQKEETL